MEKKIITITKLLLLAAVITFSNPIYCYSIEDFSHYRAIHLGGNYGNREDILNLPQDYFQFLSSLNANWIGISVALHYDDSMDSTVERKYSGVEIPTFTDDFLAKMIRKFKNQGFKIYLTLAFEAPEAEISNHPVARYMLGDPKLHLEDPNILEQFWPWSPSHPDHRRFVTEFWETLKNQTVHFAEIAEAEGVEIYSLGTETEGLFRTRSSEYWPNHFQNELKTMVNAVRSVYSGLLTYDMHYAALMGTRPGSEYLWEDLNLDMVGISAYFPLVESAPDTVSNLDSLKTSWETVFTKYLIPLKQRNPGLPILFLECGYTDSIQAPFEPAAEEFEERIFIDNDRNGLDDGQETQANIYEALFSTIDKHPNVIQGAFLWGHLMVSDVAWENSFAKMREFSVRWKLSEEIVRSVYGNWADGDSVDDDGDGFAENQGDCNDSDATVHPGATETCNGKNDDCDDQIDEGFVKDTYYPKSTA